MKNMFQSGALIDTRTEQQKDKDIHQSEIVASIAPVNWVEKAKEDFRSFPGRYQKWSGSCVAQSAAKLATVLFWLKEQTMVVFSATSVYQSRSNKPAGGMIGIEAFEIMRNKGIGLEALTPSQGMSDEEMDNVFIENYEKKIADIFRISGHVGIDARDFDAVASTIQQTKKAIMVWFYFANDEWFGLEFPEIKKEVDITEASCHSVAAVDFGMINGKQYIKIEDSAYSNADKARNALNPGDRWVSREFFEKRNFFARYPVSFNFKAGGEKPQYAFACAMKFGEKNDDIVVLQNVLKYEGLFPVDKDSTGYYGALTAKAVIAFQKKYKIATDAEIESIGGKAIGPKTLAKLNELYS